MKEHLEQTPNKTSEMILKSKKKLWPKPAAALHGEGLAADVGSII